MRRRASASERVTLSVLAAIAAVTFFLPLLSIHLPIAGDEQVTGYDAAEKIRQVTDQVRSLTGHGRGDNPSGNSPRLPRLPSTGPGDASGAPSKLPISIRLSWLIPAYIVIAFASALLTLLGSVISLTLARIASAIGGVAGILAVLQLSMLDSAIRQALEDSIQRSTGGSKGGFLAGLAQAVGNAVVGAFSLRAGVALYILAIALCLATLLAWSRLLSRKSAAGIVP